jgi:hypothetical protein
MSGAGGVVVGGPHPTPTKNFFSKPYLVVIKFMGLSIIIKPQNAELIADFIFLRVNLILS